MLVQCQVMVLLISVAIMVNSTPHGNHPCPRPPGPGNEQDTIFPNCDFGVGGKPIVSSRIGEGNPNSDHDNNSGERLSNSDLEEGNNSDNNSEGSNPTTTTVTIEDINPTQTPTHTNATVPGRQQGCTARPNPGECRGAFPRYYYNENIDQCDCFLYGGCDEEGIVYTWLTLGECLNACVPGITTQGPGCQRVTLDEVQRFLDEEQNPVNNSTSQADEALDLQTNEINSRGL